MSLRARARWLRRKLSPVAAAVVLMFVIWHVAASFLWIAPPTPLRALIPGNALQQYMIPWFGQSWSVFAPDPINGDNEILVRAKVTDGPQTVTTDWVNATDVEYALSYHNLIPPKAGTMGMHQAANFRTAWATLTAAQQDAVDRDYKSTPALERAISTGAGSTQGPVYGYLREDTRTTAYATEVAHAIWGNHVTSVQFQVQRQNIVPFAQRNSPTATKPAPIVYPTGWRAVTTDYTKADPDFQRTFAAAWAKYKASTND